MKEHFEPPFSFVSSAEDWEGALRRVQESDGWTDEAFKAAKVVAERIWPRVNDTKHDELLAQVAAGIWRDTDGSMHEQMATKLYYLTKALASSETSESEWLARTDTISPVQFAAFAQNFEKKS